MWTEQDCTIEHEGRQFSSGGAVVSPERIAAYLGKETLTDWHGNTLGTYRIVKRWRLYGAWCDEMCQVEARVDGVTYTGRSRGVGMIYKGKRKAQQPCS